MFLNFQIPDNSCIDHISIRNICEIRQKAISKYIWKKMTKYFEKKNKIYFRFYLEQHIVSKPYNGYGYVDIWNLSRGYI